MKKAITTAGTANTAKIQKFNFFAVPAVFAVVRLRFQG